MSDDIRTLAEYRAAAEETGEWESTDVDFSNDGETWQRFLIPTDEHPHPLYARATVVRKGKNDAVQQVLLWEEAIPDDEFATVWGRRPHLLFGGAVERAGLRRAFPAAVAGIVAADREARAATESPWEAKPSGPAPDAPTWDELIEAATTAEEVDAVHKQARSVRAMTPALEQQMKRRKRALAEPASEGGETDG